MIEYKRMVRTMRRRCLLGMFFLVAGIFIWQLWPIQTDQLERLITPEKSRNFYRQEGIAQALSAETKTLQRRLERHLKRLEKLRELQNQPTTPDSGANLTWNLSDIPIEGDGQQLFNSLIGDAENMLDDRRPEGAIILFDRARVALLKQLDNALAVNQLMEATQLMNSLEPNIMNEPEDSQLIDDYNAARKMAARYLEQGRMANAADTLTEFLAEQ